MLAGPIFHREALTTPRQLRHFLLRSGYIAALVMLMYTAAQVTFGWQQIRTVGAMARFGHLVFQVFSIVQLSLVLFFALLFTAGNIAQEKDRRTLILLLMTDMRDHELVLGKLWSSLLNVGVLLGVSLPAFVLVHALGGVTLSQILWSLALCAATAFAAGSWGALVAFWREKTFQTLAVGVLGLVLFWGVIKFAVAVAGGETPIGQWLAIFDPYHTLFVLLSPLSYQSGLEPIQVSATAPVAAMFGLGVVLNLLTILRLRVWNPSRFIYTQTDEEEEESEAGIRKAAARNVWANPVIWREIRTRAYGRKVIFIKLAYFVLAGFVLSFLAGSAGEAASAEKILGMFFPARVCLYRAVHHQPDADQHPSGDFADHRTRRANARTSVGHRHHRPGVRLRQTGRRALQYQGTCDRSSRAHRMVRRAGFCHAGVHDVPADRVSDTGQLCGDLGPSLGPEF